MPQIFKVSGYIIYFWSNEGTPPEPIHVHIAKGDPIPDATKIWITKSGGCIIANNNSKIPEHELNDLLAIISRRNAEVLEKWKKHHGKPCFYC